MAMANSTGFNQDLKTFLQKPFIVRSGTITSSTAGVITSVNLLQDIITQPIYQDKLVGFQGIRGKCRLKLTLNANPFQQGLLLLTYIPQAAMSGVFPSLRTTVATLYTQLPHCLMRIGKDQSVDFEIPWQDPELFYDIINNSGDLATFYLIVYSPLTTGVGGSNTVGYTLFFYFDDDVALVNPTKTTSMAGIPLKLRGEMRGTKSTRGKSVHEAEQADLGSKPVSTLLSGVAKVASAASGIPIFAPLAGPVSWAANIAKGVASAFGYSKPTVQADCVKTYQLSGIEGMAHCDGPDYSQPMTLYSSACKKLSPMTGSTVDELALESIGTRYAYYQNFAWATSDVSGTRLFATDLFALNFQLSDVDGSVPITYWTPGAFCARLCEEIRGGIKMRFTSVKTDYHAGRLLIAFFPGQTLSTAVPTLTDAAYVHSTIIDLNAGDQFEVEFPYTAPKPYKNVADAWGCMSIWVLNELVAPASVSTSIIFMVETANSPGTEYQIPFTLGFAPYMPSSVAVTDLRRNRPRPKDPSRSRYHPGKPVRVADIEDAPLGISSLSISSPAPPKHLISDASLSQEFGTPPSPLKKMRLLGEMSSAAAMPVAVVPVEIPAASSVGSAKTGGELPSSTMFAELCVGEKMLSLQQLLKRYTLTYMGYPRASTFTLAQLTSMIYRPFSTSFVTSTDGTLANVKVPYFGLDMYSMVTSMFAYRRGGVRLKLVNSPANTIATTSKMLLTSQWSTAPAATFTPGTWTNYVPSATVVTHQANPGNIQIPDYSQYAMNIVRPNFFGHDESLDDYSNQFSVTLICQAAPTDYRLYRNVAEDFQCQFFLGVPPTINYSNLPAT